MSTRAKREPERWAAFYVAIESGIDYSSGERLEALGPGDVLFVGAKASVRFVNSQRAQARDGEHGRGGSNDRAPRLLRLLLDIDSNLGVPASLLPLTREDLSGMPWLIEALLSCARVPADHPLRARRAVDLLVAIVWDQFVRRASSESGEREVAIPWVATVLECMRARAGEPWTVDSLARAAGLSRSSFADRFAREVGVTPMRWLLEQRMRLSLLWLREGLTLKEIARRAGYSSEPAFSTAFKRWSGHSPGACRGSSRRFVQRAPNAASARSRPSLGRSS